MTAWLHQQLTNPWILIGLTGQIMFTMRFIVQWLHSEKRQRSEIPVAFWFFSLGGGIVLLSYSIYKQDPVFILGQSLGLIIYLRNLALIHARKNRKGAALATKARDLTDRLDKIIRKMPEFNPQDPKFQETLSELQNLKP